MKYNLQIHHRRSIRLKEYDYSQAGAYFITICCANRESRFGKIVVGASLADAQHANARNVDSPIMELNEYGQIAYNEWIKLSERFLNFELDVFQIMPNHIHAIIVLNTDGAGFTPAQNDGDINTLLQNGQPELQNGQPQGIAPTGTHHNVAIKINATLGDMVGAYKSLVSNACLDIYKSKNKTMGKFWQRNYHEHIIRNEQSYLSISDYIINNPAKWKDDKFFNE